MQALGSCEAGVIAAGSPLAYSMDRAHYAAIFGPTAGDRVRLGDTDLIVQARALNPTP